MSYGYNTSDPQMRTLKVARKRSTLYTSVFQDPTPSDRKRQTSKGWSMEEEQKCSRGRRLTILTSEDEETAPRYDERLCVSCTSIKT